MDELNHLEKDGYNAFHKYEYVSESNVVTEVRKGLIKHDVVVTIEVKSFEVALKDDTWLTTILTEYRFIDADSGSELVYAMLGQGADKGDKGAYKAATGVNKYVLMKALQIPTGDDPEDEGKPKAKRPPARKPAKPRTTSAAPASGGTPIGDIEQEMPSVYGEEDKKSKCHYCNAWHLLKGETIVKSGLRPDGKPRWGDKTCYYNALTAQQVSQSQDDDLAGGDAPPIDESQDR